MHVTICTWLVKILDEIFVFSKSFNDIFVDLINEALNFFSVALFL